MTKKDAMKKIAKRIKEKSITIQKIVRTK